MLKTPRVGTITWHIWSKLRQHGPNNPIRWRELKALYDEHAEGRSDYTWMNLKRILMKWSIRQERGLYYYKHWSQELEKKVISRADHLYDKSRGSPEIADLPWTGGEKPKKVITIPLDLSEGGMSNVINLLLEGTNADQELKDLLVEAGKIHSRSMKNLQDASLNYAQADAYLEELLNRVRALEIK